MQPDKNSRWKIKIQKRFTNFFLPCSQPLSTGEFCTKQHKLYQVQWPFLQLIDNSNSVFTYICKTQPVKMDWAAPRRAWQNCAWFSSAPRSHFPCSEQLTVWSISDETRECTVIQLRRCYKPLTSFSQHAVGAPLTLHTVDGNIVNQIQTLTCFILVHHQHISTLPNHE
jgi:hypothetical protein